jgi:hypothetical protein
MRLNASPQAGTTQAGDGHRGFEVDRWHSKAPASTFCIESPATQALLIAGYEGAHNILANMVPPTGYPGRDNGHRDQNLSGAKFGGMDG